MSQNHYTPNFLARFWAKVDRLQNDDCWNWTATRDSWGYGQIKLDGKKLLSAHRVSWEIENGTIPKGLLVCHHCDNPTCVNPNHLFIGTNKDNAQDRVRKGREPDRAGEKHGEHKLTSNQVLEIRQKYKAENVTQKELAIQYNVSASLISFIVNNKAWRHLLS